MMTPRLDADTGALLRLADHHDTAQRAGVCAHPLLLTGTRLLVEADTGRVLHRLDTADADPDDLTQQVVATRCRNRRATVCPACSALYKLDAYHLVVAGLRSGNLDNRRVDLTRTEFEQNLRDAGWSSRTSADGKVTIFEKDGARYVTRDNAKSTGGPTADFYPSGSQDFTLKIRLN